MTMKILFGEICGVYANCVGGNYGVAGVHGRPLSLFKPALI